MNKYLILLLLMGCSSVPKQKTPRVIIPKICKGLIIRNFSNQPWNARDSRQIKISAYDCNKKWKGCLQQLRKTRDLGYSAICSVPVGEDK